MAPVATALPAALEAELRKHGQEHLIDHLQRLTADADRASLLAQLQVRPLESASRQLAPMLTRVRAGRPPEPPPIRTQALDYAHLERAFRVATAVPTASVASPSLAPIPEKDTESVLTDPGKTRQWHDRGMALVRAGKVGVLLMAGGQVRLRGRATAVRWRRRRR